MLSLKVLMRTCRFAAVGDDGDDDGCCVSEVGYIHEVLLVAPWDGIFEFFLFFLSFPGGGGRKGIIPVLNVRCSVRRWKD
jgi:hypothetical protein